MTAAKAKARLEAVGGSAVIDVKVLRAAAKHVAALANARDATPVLAGVLITSGPSTMTLRATDLDSELSCQIDLAESGTGMAMRLVVNASTLEKIVAKLPKDGQVRLAELGNTAMQISCGSASFDLPVIPADDFPLLSPGDWDVQFEMPRADLMALLSAVRFAISTEETRYYLNGIFIQAVDAGPEAGRLLSAATDGHRLAQYHVPLPEGAEGMPDCILPRRMVAILERLLDGSDFPMIDVAVSTSRMRFDVGAVSLVTKLIDGQFPDHRRVIPTANDKALWISPKDMIAAIERVTTVAEGKTRAVKLSLDGEAMTLEASSPERGSAREGMAVNYSGEPQIGRAHV
jgi:DNA polymerase-3 subunit beta